MNTFSRAVLATVLAGVASFAQANTSYSADFRLADNQLPHLRTGIPGFDTNALPGAWAYERSIDASSSSRELLSSTVNPDTGAIENTWGQKFEVDNTHRYPYMAPLWMGESSANIPGPNLNSTAVKSEVYHSGLRADALTTTLPAEVKGSATWTRGFSLDANSSFTFSGIATLGITGDGAPLNTVSTFNTGASFASLTLGDLFGRVGTTIGASLWGITSGISDFFSYSVDPSGLISLTITNKTNSVLQGTMNAGAYVNVSPPIPEPETWMLLLAGAGLVGAATRKRLKPATVVPALA